MFPLDASLTAPTTDWLAILAIVISVLSALFTCWQTLVFKRMSELQKQELDLQRKDYELHEQEWNREKERFL